MSRDKECDMIIMRSMTSHTSCYDSILPRGKFFRHHESKPRKQHETTKTNSHLSTIPFYVVCMPNHIHHHRHHARCCLEDILSSAVSFPFFVRSNEGRSHVCEKCDTFAYYESPMYWVPVIIYSEQLFPDKQQ